MNLARKLRNSRLNRSMRVAIRLASTLSAATAGTLAHLLAGEHQPDGADFLTGLHRGVDHLGQVQLQGDGAGLDLVGEQVGKGGAALDQQIVLAALGQLQRHLPTPTLCSMSVLYEKEPKAQS